MIIIKSYKQTYELLVQHKNEIQKLADFLLQNLTVTANEIDELFDTKNL